jgi:hypothetical protein
MFGLFMTTTRCLEGWPLFYRAAFPPGVQETEPPFRYAKRAYILRFWRRGLVVGRWSGSRCDEDSAHTFALGASQIPVLDDDGYLLENFQPRREGEQ